MLNSYRYGFNGKENDNEVQGQGNSYDFGARIYDPRLGKFLTRDPLANSQPWSTPYSFAANSPIAFIDANGMQPETPYELWDKSNTYTYASGTTIYLIDNQWVFQYHNNPWSSNPNDLTFLYYDDVAQKWLSFTPVAYKDYYDRTIGDAITQMEQIPNTAALMITGADDWVTVTSGIDATTGEQVGTGGRILAGACAIAPIVSGKTVKWIAEFAGLANKYGFGKCVEFAYDFGRRAVKYADKTGETVKRFKIDIGSGYLGTNIGDGGLSQTGYHEFIEVFNKETNTTMIFDNVYQEGIEKSKYIENLVGSNKSGALNGKEIFDTPGAVQEISINNKKASKRL